LINGSFEMKRLDKRSVGLTLLAILLIALGILAYLIDKPGEVPAVYIQAALDWGGSLTSPAIGGGQVTIQISTTNFVVDLLIPLGGKDKNGAVVFTTGSGPNVYLAYFGIDQKYVPSSCCGIASQSKDSR